MSDAYIGLTTDRIINSWSAGAERLYGYIAAEVVGRSIAVLAATNAPDEAALLRDDQSVEALPAVHRHKDGRHIAVLVSASACLDAHGKVVGIITRHRAGDGHSTAGDAAQAGEQRLRESFEQAVLGMAQIGLDGRYLRVNHALCRLLGYSEAELLDRRVQDLTAPEDQQSTEAAFAQWRSGRVSEYRTEKRYVHKAGHIVWVEIHGALVRDAGGRPLHVVNQTQDISERKAAEIALSQSEERFRTLIEQAPEAILVYDAVAKRFVHANRRAVELFGRHREEFLGIGPAALWSAAQRDGRPVQESGAEYLARALSGEEVVYDRVFIHSVRGERHCEARLVRLPSATGALVRLSVTDVSDRVLVTRALARANRAFAAITACNQAIVRANTEVELLAQVCKAIVSDQRYSLAWVGYKRDDTQRSVEPMAWAGSASDYLRKITISWADTPLGNGPAGKALRTGITQVMQDMLHSTAFEPWLEAASGQGFASSIGIPLHVDGNVIGVLSIYASEPEAFDEDEQRVLTGLAEDLSYGIAARRARADNLRVADALRMSEARFRAVFEQAGVGIAVSDRSGVWRLVNYRLCAMLGYEEHELRDHTFTDFAHPDEQPAGAELLRQAAAGVFEPIDLERRYLHRDGHDVWLRVNVTPWQDQAGLVQGSVVIFQDVTTRKRAEEALSRSEERYRRIVETANEGVIVADPNHHITAVNARLAEMVGYTVDELLGMPIVSLIAHDDRNRVLERWVDRVQGFRGNRRYDLQLLCRDGSIILTEVSTSDLLDDYGNFVGLLGLVTDVTARRQAEAALRKAAAENATLAAAVSTTSVGVVVTDPTQRENPIIYVNQAYQQITGYAEHEVVGRDSHYLEGDATNATVLHAIDEATKHRQPFSGTLLQYRKDGTPIWTELRITPILDAQGMLRNWVGLITDVTERVRMLEDLERMALHDQLTGLPNRSLLLDRTAQAILRAVREKTHVALLLLDLDHFKEVNDTFGHAVGDELLRLVAELLQGAVRGTDTVARLGGDEFAVLLPATDARGAATTAATLRRVLSEPVLVEGRALRANASIGIAHYPEQGLDAAALLLHADVAMYQVKRAQRTSLAYEPGDHWRGPDRAALVEDLRGAIGRAELRLYYQPIVQLSTGKVTAVEALVRWQHPVHGMLFPDVFVPLLEGLGQVGELTHWVLTEGLRQQREWRGRGLDLQMNINLAAADLHDQRLLAEICTLLSDPETASRLCLELTEGALLADLAHTRTALLRLAAAGALVAIDDFGTGYSSLSRLARLPVDELKIDRLFVAAMQANAVEAAIVASTIGLAHSLGIPVVAEGVEDEATHLHLHELGCDFVQGYHYSRPLPVEDFEHWTATR